MPDTILALQNCYCLTSVNAAVPQPNGPGGADSPTEKTSPGGGFSGGSSGENNDDRENLKSLLESDASLLTGEYLPDHQLATYQSQEALSGIDLQFSSLQADPLPVVSAFLTTGASSDSPNITSITAALTVNSVSQGSAITYDDISLTNGETYLVQVQAVNVSGYATGIYSTSLTIAKTFSDIGPVNHSYPGSLMIVNDSASPYGSGWSIGGLQQITVGVGGISLMITDGSDPPRGVHFDRRRSLHRRPRRYLNARL